MKAVVKYGFGPRETELRDVPIPEIGDDDLLIEVKAAGVCGSDIAFDDGGHKEILNPPVVLGHEFSGMVCKVGKNVTKWKVGDRVMSDNTGEVCGECYACNTADFLSCPERKGIGYGMDGGFTNYVKILGKTLARVPHSLMRIPDCMSYEEAAIMDPACNGYMAVVQEAKVMPGDFVALESVDTETGNIAGVPIPIYKGIRTRRAEIDLLDTPAWFDDAQDALEKAFTFDARRDVLSEQRRLVSEELRATSQRVNLFEKVKIPECQENIRVIRIHLGDESTAAVARGKIAKRRGAATARKGDEE